MAITKFKATCLAAQERVRKTGRVLRITRFGRPIADICPPKPDGGERRGIGAGTGTVTFVGDIVSPLAVEWEVLSIQKLQRHRVGKRSKLTE